MQHKIATVTTRAWRNKPHRLKKQLNNTLRTLRSILHKSLLNVRSNFSTATATWRAPTILRPPRLQEHRTQKPPQLQEHLHKSLRNFRRTYYTIASALSGASYTKASATSGAPTLKPSQLEEHLLHKSLRNCRSTYTKASATSGAPTLKPLRLQEHCWLNKAIWAYRLTMQNYRRKTNFTLQINYSNLLWWRSYSYTTSYG